MNTQEDKRMRNTSHLHLARQVFKNCSSSLPTPPHLPGRRDRHCDDTHPSSAKRHPSPPQNTKPGRQRGFERTSWQTPSLALAGWAVEKKTRKVQSFGGGGVGGGLVLPIAKLFGTGWNRLWLVQGSPSLSRPNLPCSPGVRCPLLFNDICSRCSQTFLLEMKSSHVLYKSPFLLNLCLNT